MSYGLRVPGKPSDQDLHTVLPSFAQLALSCSNPSSIVDVIGILFAKLLRCHGIKGNGAGERCCATKQNPQKERLAAEQVEDINTSLESEISHSGSSC